MGRTLIVGIVLTALFVAILWGSGGSWWLFSHPLPFLFVVFYVASSTVLTAGGPALMRSLRGLGCLLSGLFPTLHPQWQTGEQQRMTKVYAAQIKASYVAGLIGFIIGALSIHFYAAQHSADTGLPANYSYAYAVNLLTVFYAIVIAELIIRRAQQRLRAGYHYSL